ncbi:MAG: hypothetical protein EBU31_17240, partial [Proteobacteria bacterium]|nr:hypothetical protein [Pseudomonadota bacterium]
CGVAASGGGRELVWLHGTIAHVLLEEAPASRARAVVPMPVPMPMPVPPSVAVAGSGEAGSEAETETLAVTVRRKRYPLRSSGPQHRHRLLQTCQREAISQSTVYGIRLHAGILRDWLSDHVLYGEIVLPGASLLELSCAALARSRPGQGLASERGSDSVRLDGLTVLRPVVAVDTREGQGKAAGTSSATRLYCVLGSGGSVEVYGEDKRGRRVLHAEGSAGESSGEDEPDWVALSRAASEAQERCTEEADVTGVYEGFAAQGLPYGRTFRLLRAGRASGDGRSVVATLGLEEVRGLAGSYVVPPPLIDALLHAVAVSGAGTANANANATAPSKAKVPFSFDRVWMRPSAAARLWESEACTAHVEVRSVSEDMVVLDCSLLSGGGGGGEG